MQLQRIRLLGEREEAVAEVHAEYRKQLRMKERELEEEKVWCRASVLEGVWCASCEALGAHVEWCWVLRGRAALQASHAEKVRRLQQELGVERQVAPPPSSCAFAVLRQCMLLPDSAGGRRVGPRLSSYVVPMRCATLRFEREVPGGGRMRRCRRCWGVRCRER